jgi:hypothetical protein
LSALTPAHLAAVEELTGQAVEQARALVESVGLSAEEWQTPPLLINLPSLNVIAALVLAEAHGRCGRRRVSDDEG